jgi:hypothetical protein
MGYTVYLIGGCVREVLRQAAFGSAYRFDFDIAYSCCPAEICRIAAMHGWQYRRSNSGLCVKIGTIDLREHIEGMDLSFSVLVAPVDRDFCINSVYFNVSTKQLLDPTEHGLDDIFAGRLRIPVPRSQWQGWLYGDRTRKFNKLFRFWKFLSRGFTSTEETASFMATSARTLFEDPLSPLFQQAYETGVRFLRGLRQEGVQSNSSSCFADFLAAVQGHMGVTWFVSCFCQVFPDCLTA